ncbi:glycosyltransferase [Scytonema sp. NUACC21]
MALISVVIPAYNAEKTIRETIESVLNQTYSNLEVLVINDGSQDSTLNILSSIKDPRLKIYSYPNGGIPTSRNRGIEKASGEYISFIDSDDLWTPDKLEAQFKALQANPQAAVAYSWVNYITQSGNFFRQGNYITANGNAYKQLLVQNFLENGSNPLIRKQAFAEVGNFDTEIPGIEDWDMWLRLAFRYDFVAVPSPQILYRMSVNSMSTKIVKMEASCLKFLDKAYSQAPTSLQHLKKEALSKFYHYLSCKALEAPSERRNAFIAARCFWNAIKYDPSMLLQWQAMLKAYLKIFAVFLLPPQQSRGLIETFKRLFIKQPSFSKG